MADALAIRASHAKGVALRGLLTWYESAYGRERLVSAFRRLPPAEGCFFDEHRELLGVLPSSWYPMSLVNGLLDELLRDFGPAERAGMAQAAARHVMSSTLTGIHRRLFEMFATPKLYARFAQKLWHAYYDTGIFQVRCLDEHSAESVVSAWGGHTAFTCDLNTHAASLIYEAMGLTGVAARRTACVDDGAAGCRVAVSWT